MTGLEQELEDLKNKLREAIEARDSYEDGSPAVEYCLICDEYSLRYRVDDGRNWLDCFDEHYKRIITQDWEHAGIGSWIQCLEWVQDRLEECGEGEQG